MRFTSVTLVLLFAVACFNPNRPSSVVQESGTSAATINALSRPLDAATTTIASFEQEESGTVVNSCLTPPEAIHFDGIMHIVAGQTTDAAGGQHTIFRYNFDRLSAVGITTGNVYHNQSVKSQVTAIPGASGTQEATFDWNIRFIGVGTVPNFIVHISTHVTQLADGTITADASNIFVTCH